MNKPVFNYYEDGVVRIEDGATSVKNSETKLLSGFYKVRSTQGMFGRQMSLEHNFPKIPKNSYKFAKQHLDTEYLDKLFTSKSKMIHEDLNIRRKVGYLLHGKQGSGKTTTMFCISRMIVEKYEACVFSVSDADELNYILNALREIRKISNFTAVILFDECEYTFQRSESFIKRVLDGDLTPEDTIFICSTNYLDEIPETIKDRPSRFKYVIDISLVKQEDLVYDILNNMNNSLRKEIQLSKEEIKIITPKGVDHTMDEIKNMFTDACFKSINLEVRIEAISDNEDREKVPITIFKSPFK